MSVYQKYIYHLLAPQRALVVTMMLIYIFPATFFRFSLIPRHGGAYPRPLTSISKDWPSLMESLEMRKARFPKLIYGGKEKFENKKIRAGFCAKLKRKCHPLLCPGHLMLSSLRLTLSFERCRRDAADPEKVSNVKQTFFQSLEVLWR